MDTNVRKLRRDDLLYPETSYTILGVLFNVWRNLGYGHKEKIYQKAIAHDFRKLGIDIREQLPSKVIYDGESLGIYYFDFLVNNQIVLEIKVRNYFSKKDIEQLFTYLKSCNMKLGIIAHFTQTGVKYKRVVNIS